MAEFLSTDELRQLDAKLREVDEDLNITMTKEGSDPNLPVLTDEGAKKLLQPLPEEVSQLDEDLRKLVGLFRKNIGEASMRETDYRGILQDIAELEEDEKSALGEEAWDLIKRIRKEIQEAERGVARYRKAVEKKLGEAA